jgi:cysteinyl-tRNA synthetase
MKIYDSLIRNFTEFEPVEGKKVIMYVCGLTPYDSAHLGHARTYVAFDVIKRYLIKKEYGVYHIQNITDVEDKIIKRCKETGDDPRELTERVHAEALELFDKLNILRADVYPKVTEHIADITGIIKKIIENGYAYETKTGVYFDVNKFSGYGRLSGQRIEEINRGQRVDIDKTKKDPADFALWKKEEDIMAFDSPWGKGRPGWHIECSALSMKYAGRPTLDIHGGARDLIFPHHENEIAQSEAATGKLFSKYWLHTGFLTVRGEKMSKSLGNFITVKDSLAKFPPNALRFFFVHVHYRSPIDYSEKEITAARDSAERILNVLRMIKENKGKDDRKSEEFRKRTKECIKGFYDVMDNDFDTPEAIANIFNLVKEVNKELEKESVDQEALGLVERELKDMLWILGIREETVSLDDKKDALLSLAERFAIDTNLPLEEVIKKFIEAREDARKKKDYETSDSIRARLRDIGIILEDKKEGGTAWRIE